MYTRARHSCALQTEKLRIEHKVKDADGSVNE